MISAHVRRTGPYEAYWHFAAERQAIFYRRVANTPLNNSRCPWTHDQVLGRHKFCNAYRASDRASQFLIRNVIYGDGYSLAEEDIIFRTLLFRLFNRINTWDLVLKAHDGEPHWANGWPQQEHLSKLMSESMAAKQPVFGGAYMIPPPGEALGRRFDSKHAGYLALVQHATQSVLSHLTQLRSLGDVYKVLRELPLIGNFMAYQLATDLNYSDLWQFDENQFTMPGPGAERGIDKCFVLRGGYEQMIYWMVENQETELRKLDYDPQKVWLWGRPLKAIDCQNLFCETDKYCRVRFPELASSRVKIKAKYATATTERISYFYPPWWGINHLLGATP